MKCHYEILNVPRDTGDDDIKKSYRKLALKYHPDKNPDNIEECTRQFHLIQQAYDVLIDPQERAWYDKHREAILKGGLGKGGEYEDDGVDVYQFFNTACFSGYGDGEKDFYSVYRKVFQTIAAQDLEFMDDAESDRELPEFGTSQSVYEEVVGPFYGYWESYCTAKSYVWVEKYDTREAPSRQIRRLMEQDNKKLRDKAKKERNEEVRALVAFVRKRDKRVQAYKKLLEERALESAKKAEERKKKDREHRLKELENYKETEWSAMSEKDLEQLEANCAQQFGEEGNEPLSGEDSEDFEEDDYLDDDLFCVACNRDFKTEKSFANHERSKKHKENIAFLKAELRAEEAAFGGENGSVEGEAAVNGTASSEEEANNTYDNAPKQKLSKKQKKKRKQKMTNMAMEVDEIDELSEKVTDILVDDGGCNPQKAEHENNDAVTASSAESVSTEPPGDQVAPPGDQTEAAATIDTACDQNLKEKKPQKKENTSNSIPQNCHVCSATFKSRNKLFDHIKKTGHARFIENIPPAIAEASGGKSKKKKKGKR